ncbi:Golgi-associated plant pathogenesis-related protein 1-like [Acropora muricata]|uniref:Golgi-associated plant pathogenesis-related protein 1-like n=1 Tax=Acropora muricata TaxID=159855 RepID=UPI0034E52211
MNIWNCLYCISVIVLQQAVLAEAVLPFKNQCLIWHNEYRLKHQVEAVTWNETLAKGAIQWASYLAANDKFEHEKNIIPGENLYLSGTPPPKEPCSEASQLFYAEIKDYDYDKPGFTMRTGHFTQLVWKKTREIGADFKIRTDGRLVVVVRYFPPGNYVGEEPFRNNVLRPKDWQPPTQPDENGGIALVFSNFVLITFIVVVLYCLV